MNLSTRRIILVALSVVALDQITKQLIKTNLPLYGDKVVLKGFFRLVHWGNTGAAWSLFNDNNNVLAIVALVALFVLFRSRHHFDAHRLTGQIALGLIFGGIIGNLIDRLHDKSVTDFLYFYLLRRGGDEVGFPAFNVADSAICVGVGIIFLLSWRKEKLPLTAAPPAA